MLCRPGASYAIPGNSPWKPQVEIPQTLEITQTQRAGTGRSDEIQAVKIRIPVLGLNGRAATLSLTFRFPDLEKFEPRQRLSFLWCERQPCDKHAIEIPTSLRTPVQEVISVATTVDWKGSLRDYMLWQSYFA